MYDKNFNPNFFADITKAARVHIRQEIWNYDFKFVLNNAGIKPCLEEKF